MTSADDVEERARVLAERGWTDTATLLRTLLRERDEAVIAFAKAIEHGDDIHKDWLREATQCFVNCKPLPAPRQGVK